MRVSLSNRHVNLIINIVRVGLFDLLFLNFSFVETGLRAWPSGYWSLAHLLFVNLYSTILLLECIGSSEDLGNLNGRTMRWLRKVAKNRVSALPRRLQHVLVVENARTRAIHRSLTFPLSFCHKVSVRRLLVLSLRAQLGMEVNDWRLRKLFEVKWFV